MSCCCHAFKVQSTVNWLDHPVESFSSSSSSYSSSFYLSFVVINDLMYTCIFQVYNPTTKAYISSSCLSSFKHMVLIGVLLLSHIQGTVNWLDHTVESTTVATQYVSTVRTNMTRHSVYTVWQWFQVAGSCLAADTHSSFTHVVGS